MATVRPTRGTSFDIEVWRGMNRGTMGFVRNSVGTKGAPMVGVVEWTAPVRNSAWVAACFGTVDR
jgi:hypothetical protein